MFNDFIIKLVLYFIARALIILVIIFPYESCYELFRHDIGQLHLDKNYTLFLFLKCLATLIVNIGVNWLSIYTLSLYFSLGRHFRRRKVVQLAVIIIYCRIERMFELVIRSSILLEIC